MTYSDPAVSQYIREKFVPIRPILERRADWPLFRSHHIIWTPTIGFMDRNGSMHYHSVGYLPPEEFLSVLRIGRARCLIAWTRNAEAISELEVAAAARNTYSAEALYWLGISHFLSRRSTTGMWDAWDHLSKLYPDSTWARKIYPREE